MSELRGTSDLDANQVLILVRLAVDGGGRVDPARIYSRPPTSHARIAFEEAQDAGWLDKGGYVTAIGREALDAAE